MDFEARLKELNKRFTKLSAGETLLVRVITKALLNPTGQETGSETPPMEELKKLVPLMTGAERELYRAVLKTLQVAVAAGSPPKHRKSGYSLRSRSIHPPIKDEQGNILANNPSEFARKQGLKYNGMLNGIDALTAARNTDGDDLSYHFAIINYGRDGIIVRKTPGHGYRTYSEEVDEWREGEGLPPIYRPKQKTPGIFGFTKEVTAQNK